MTAMPIDTLICHAAPGAALLGHVGAGRLLEVELLFPPPGPNPGDRYRGRIAGAAPGMDSVFVELGGAGRAVLRTSDLRAAGLAGADGSLVELTISRAGDAEKLPACRLAEAGEANGVPGLLAAAPAPLPAALSAHRRNLRRILIDDRGLQLRLAGMLRECGVETELVAGMDGFEAAGVAEQFAAARAPEVPLAGGGRVRIAETGFLTAIDVDAGAAVTGQGQGAAATVNLAAADVIAAQLRLRNLAGPVLIDFITLRRRAERASVLERLAQAGAGDPAGLEVMGMTRLGLVEVKRGRRGRPLRTVLEMAGVT